MLTLETMLAHAAKVARHTFQERGEVQPMWVGHRADGELVFFTPRHFSNARDKDATVAQVRAVFRTQRVVMFSYICEAWVLDSRATTPESAERAMQMLSAGGSLEHHPDRREIVAVQAEDKTRSLMGHYFILRPEHGKPTLSPFRRMPESEVREGRMVGLLGG